MLKNLFKFNYNARTLRFSKQVPKMKTPSVLLCGVSNEVKLLGQYRLECDMENCGRKLRSYSLLSSILVLWWSMVILSSTMMGILSSTMMGILSSSLGVILITQ